MSSGTNIVNVSVTIKADGKQHEHWVSPGSYTLQKGNSNTVIIAAKGADGVVAADALLFVPEKK